MSDCQTGLATAATLYGVLPNVPKECEGAKDFRAFDLITVVMMVGGPSMNEADKFAKKVMADWELGLYDAIPPEKYIPYASEHPCFIKWLLREGYIKEKVKDDKWDPKSGNWVRVDWKDVGLFLPGVMINRVLRGNDAVMEITKQAYWRDWINEEELLAINTRSKSNYPSGSYYKTHYYLSDLFNGQVYLRKEASK